MRNLALPISPDQAKQWFIEKAGLDPLQQAFQTLRDQRICIMGGCGQVGSHLVALLYSLGLPPEQIIINDNLQLGIRENLPPSLRDRVDTRSHKDFAEDPPAGIDSVIFVGGRSSVPHFQTLDDVLAEVATWTSILTWCREANIRLIFASTSSLCKTRPSVETQRVWPGSLYELAKLMMEDMSIQQALCDGLILQLCRFFSVYGVTEQHKGPYGNLYTQILWHGLEQRPFELWGLAGKFLPGEQTRDIIFAPEVARALLFLLTLPQPHPLLDDIDEVTYNIGLGHPIAVKTMIQQVSSILPPDLQPQIIEMEAPPSMDNYVVHTWGNPNRLMNAGFVPIYTDHLQNLIFIAHALMAEPDWYWSIVQDLRDRQLTRLNVKESKTLA